MELSEVLKWIGITVLVFWILCPSVTMVFGIGRKDNPRDTKKAGCGCMTLVLVAGFWAAVIACIVKFVIKYLL